MSVESLAYSKFDTHPRQNKQKSRRKALNKHLLKKGRENIARGLADSWNNNIGGAHEKVTLRDAKIALKKVDKRELAIRKTLTPEQQAQRPPLSTFLYELEGSENLRQRVIDRELAEHYSKLPASDRPNKKGPEHLVYIWPTDNTEESLNKIKTDTIVPEISTNEPLQPEFTLPALPDPSNHEQRIQKSEIPTFDTLLPNIPLVLY